MATSKRSTSWSAVTRSPTSAMPSETPSAERTASAPSPSVGQFGERRSPLRAWPALRPSAPTPAARGRSAARAARAPRRWPSGWASTAAGRRRGSRDRSPRRRRRRPPPGCRPGPRRCGAARRRRRSPVDVSGDDVVERHGAGLGAEAEGRRALLPASLPLAFGEVPARPGVGQRRVVVRGGGSLADLSTRSRSTRR